MNRGYIKLWRKVEDTGLLQDPPLLSIWCWCLLRATYKPRTIAMRTGRGNTLVELIPGEFVTGINSSKELKMKPSTFRDRLKRLERMGMIAILPATHYSKISIVKWDAYQADEEVERQPTVNQPSANRQPTATNKKVSSRESKKESKDYTEIAEGVVELWHTYATNLPRVQKITAKRVTAIKTRMKDFPTFNDWADYFRQINHSAFLTGDNNNGWTCNLDWVMNEANMTKIVEGNYDNREQQQRKHKESGADQVLREMREGEQNDAKRIGFDN